MNRIFIGHDHRQPVSMSALFHSIIYHAKRPVAITPLVLPALPIKRQGLTPFTFTRFLVPHLCEFKPGWALFMDVDMILRADINELFDFADDSKAVMVQKHPTRRFEWASLILFNTGHEACKVLTPNFIEEFNGLHVFKWLPEHLIGNLPEEWNHCVGYSEPNPDAKLVHYTMGVPAYPQTQGSEHAQEWRELATYATSTVEWETLMGKSVHTTESDGKLTANLEAWKKQA